MENNNSNTTTRKVFTEEEKQTIELTLEEKYGFKGEDFEVLYIRIRGNEKAYAVKSPNKMVWNAFRNDVQAGKKKPSEIETNLSVDCLITDVDGVAKLEDFKADIEIKPALSAVLSGKVAELATAGLNVSEKKD